MEIQLTSKLSFGGSDIAAILLRPYKETVDTAKVAAIGKAANHFVSHHRIILTLQTLPDDIYARLHKGDHLILKNCRYDNPKLSVKYPLIDKLIGGQWAGGDGTPVEEVIDSLPEAKAEHDAILPLEKRGETFRSKLLAYFDKANFKSTTQLCWSAPNIVSAILHIDKPETRYSSRRYSPRQIFLDELQERRYIEHSKKRRPKIVVPMPEELNQYLGEAKLLHTALSTDE